jgi:uncharacterized RDD family membrane protein YckC
LNVSDLQEERHRFQAKRFSMEAGFGLNTMSAAQLEILPPEDTGHAAEIAQRPGAALRQQAAERLAAHRQRRSRQGHAAAQAHLDIELPQRKNKIAAAVAERYAHSPSYRAFLAEEAQKAIRQAAAAAEVAARNAEAIANAQHELLAELELWTAPQKFTPQTAVTHSPQAVPLPAQAEKPAAAAPSQPNVKPAPPDRPARPYAPLKPSVPVKEVSAAGLTVRLYEDLGRPQPPSQKLHRGSVPALESALDLEEVEALEEEIAFRQSPVFEDFRDPTGAVESIPANLVEFPRQLVATRKARPRLAEGPLRDEAPRSPQLRIFEVEPEQISHTPAPQSSAPEWSSIRLEALDPHSQPALYADYDTNADDLLPSLLPPQTAPMPLRAMAVLVDCTIILGAFVAFAAVAASVSGEVPTGPTAGIAAAGTVSVLYLLYQALFFTLSDQTPGMRLARIGLCTLSDENPSRSAMRKRIVAILIAASPLGIGLLWIFLDDDKLGWHDRISRMYQRAY